MASADTRAIMAAATRSPEDAFGLLRSALGSLERHLSVTRADVLQRERGRAGDAVDLAGHGLAHVRLRLALRPVHRPARFASRSRHLRRTPAIPSTRRRTDASATAGRTGDYGNLVVIEHAFGLTTRYGHLSKIAVQPGIEVKRGHVIGYVGSTGRSTSSHLHYEVWANGRPVNPLKLLVGRPE